MIAWALSFFSSEHASLGRGLESNDGKGHEEYDRVGYLLRDAHRFPERSCAETNRPADVACV